MLLKTLYFENELESDSIVVINIEKNINTNNLYYYSANISSYDLETLSNLKTMMKYDIMSGEGWAIDNAEDGEWKTLDEYKKRWLGEHPADYYIDICFAGIINDVEYWIRESSFISNFDSGDTALNKLINSTYDNPCYKDCFDMINFDNFKSNEDIEYIIKKIYFIERFIY